ncbi:MAG: helix-turn-helix domain-containing protein [Woeseiaceae bacterium]|nr:helix-turn-helix domain-containing protein [Woeseiaceae bacterium]
MLQSEIYERARLARDPRFDGQFFIGVNTTGIYCRPICPAVSPKRENIAYFPSAAAAGEAGFRPCLRCRPECAPGTPAWSGTSTTVRRGLRLISSGALDDGNVEQLADRLGVTSRHLRRLFGRHLGASPLAVASTQRLHFAKRLIDETSLPMSCIAEAAGYGSVRRFNDSMKANYGRTPRELRNGSSRRGLTVDAATLSVRLAYRNPFEWQSLLKFFALRATPGVESVVGDRYRRTASLNGSHAIIELQANEASGHLLLTLYGVATTSLFETVQRCREMFDLDAPIADISAVLERDPVLAGLLQKQPGVRVPGSWDGFELAVRAILGQQVSVKAATTLAGRIATSYGEELALPDGVEHGELSRVFPQAERLQRARIENCGIIRARAGTIRVLARAVSRGELSFDASQDPEEFCEALKSIKGIGDWTAQYVAMRCLKNPDAFPASDLGLIKAIDRPLRVTPARLLARAEEWRPWRAYAALLLWGSDANSGG